MARKYNALRALTGKKNRTRLRKASNTVKKVNSLAAKVGTIMSFMNTEKKRIDTNYTTAENIEVTNGMIKSINAPAHGDAADNRNGNSIKLYSYQINGRIRQLASTQSASYVKMWLVSFDATGEGTPTISEFLNADANGNYSSMSLRNPDRMSDFKVLAHKRIKIPQRTVSTERTDAMFSLYGKFRGLHQRFSGSTAASITSNQLYLIWVTDDGTTASTNAVELASYQARINYIDN